MGDFKLSRKRYIIVTSDMQKVLCHGINQRYTFGEIDAEQDILNVKTFRTYDNALRTGIWFIFKTTEDDFKESGKYRIIPIVETIEQIKNGEDI